MSDLKTKPHEANVETFLNSVEHSQRREDSLAMLEIMKEITGEEPKMWGPSIVGFGNYHYKYESGREGDFFITGFSPRKQSLTLYIMSGFSHYDELLQKLGKHKTGKSCLYIKKLEDVDMDVLKQMIRESVKMMREKYPEE
ncbi:MAG: DUF1801 domain-containing protein [Phaeodactylibacter sp.]|nr:DUF1801 domain-containing protein [Phaeodactylibacter sp.]